MPNAGKQHGNHQIELGASEAFFAAAQRDIDIVANPSGQADVPSVPEVADVDGAKRRGKVFRQLEAEQHGQADDQIRVAGKVEKELEGVAINRRQHAPAVELGRIFKNRRYPAFRQCAGKPPLFGNTQHNQANCQSRINQLACLFGADLRQCACLFSVYAFKSGCADNRTRCDGREEAEMKQELVPFKTVSFRLAVAIHQVSQRLESVIRQAQRQKDVDDGALPRILLNNRAEKVEIFEETQNSQCRRNTATQPKFADILVFRKHQYADQVNHRRVNQNQCGKNGVDTVKPA